MIKFEEHEGQLFRMLDKPVQLKEKNTNVLVQFITHGVIGEYVMEHWLDCGQENAPIFVDSVDSDGDVIVFIENGNKYGCPFPMFEIIGYPVEEGSCWWALYQMMQGEKICHHKSPSIVYCKHAGDIRRQVRYNCVDYMSASAWLNGADKNGWQIYKEPEPEPAKEQFEVGDWVKYDIDFYVQVIEPSSYDDLMKMPKDRTLCRTLSGINVYPYTSLLTKASHSEVIVPITISGTVRPAYNEDGTIDDEQFQLLPNGSWDGTEMFISFDALDSHTRKLVESLLKAREEEK